MNDEMMSQDAAFGTDNNVKQEDVFKFDEPKGATPDSQPNEEDKEIPSDEESSTEEDGQKVPYTRFKKKVDELNEVTSKIQFLEEQLEEIRNSKVESRNEDIEPDEAFKKLYGDNDIAREAYKIQLQRDNEIAERAVEQAIERMTQREKDEAIALSQNEETIDNNLEDLQEKLGRKLTNKQEEEILSIVDEFSPTGNDGKYITLFPFDKAYEIYALRNNSKARPTQQARESIAGLTSGTSEGEIESSQSEFKRGWTSWESAI